MNAMRDENEKNDQQEVDRVFAERELERQRRIAEYRKAATPVLNDLARIGFSLEAVEDLYHQPIDYRSAIPVLLKWLPLVENLDVKEAIVRALSVPWAKPIAAQALVQEFHKLQNESNTGIKWAIGNALEVVADDSVFSDIVELINDPSNGKSREMLAMALGKMKDPRAEDVLIALLDDEEMVGHALIGLRRLKSKKAVPAIERFRNYPKTWIRNEAKKALLKIEKVSKK